MRTSLPVVGERRFLCTNCGACCRAPGRVYFAQDEIDSISSLLCVSEEELKKKYELIEEEEDAGEYYVKATEDKPCPFLTIDNLCSIQSAKPRQCSSFPFWPELLDDVDAWNSAAVICEGIDHPDGEVFGAVQIKKYRLKLEG